MFLVLTLSRFLREAWNGNFLETSSCTVVAERRKSSSHIAFSLILSLCYGRLVFVVAAARPQLLAAAGVAAAKVGLPFIPASCSPTLKSSLFSSLSQRVRTTRPSLDDRNGRTDGKINCTSIIQCFGRRKFQVPTREQAMPFRRTKKEENHPSTHYQQPTRTHETLNTCHIGRNHP